MGFGDVIPSVTFGGTISGGLGAPEVTKPPFTTAPLTFGVSGVLAGVVAVGASGCSGGTVFVWFVTGVLPAVEPAVAGTLPFTA